MQLFDNSKTRPYHHLTIRRFDHTNIRLFDDSTIPLSDFSMNRPYHHSTIFEDSKIRPFYPSIILLFDDTTTRAIGDSTLYHHCTNRRIVELSNGDTVESLIHRIVQWWYKVESPISRVVVSSNCRCVKLSNLRVFEYSRMVVWSIHRKVG